VTIGAMTGSSADESGLASGLINTSQQVGGALGLAILSTIAFSDVPEGRPDPVALTNGFGDAFLTGAGFALIAVLIAVFAVRTEDSEAMKNIEPAAIAA